jgi:AraC family transcriptional regulator
MYRHMHSIHKQYTYNRGLYASVREAPAARCRTLYSGQSVSITEHDARTPAESGAVDAISPGHRLIVTRRGAALVRRTAAGQAVAAEPLQAITLEAGVAYVLEPVDAVHSFTVFTFGNELASSTLALSGAALMDAPLAPHALLDSRFLIAFHRLRQTRGAPAANVEGDSSALLRAVWDADRTRRVTASHRVVRRYSFAGRRRGEIVERVKCLLASAPEAAHALDDLSERLGISTSQLAHVFPRETGLSPHRYLLHLRAALALGELSAGATDLSRLALDLGFATHSHFSAAFRRCTGMPPSEARPLDATSGRLDHSTR